MRNCSREDFENFNAIDIYNNLETIDFILDSEKNFTVRYCFDIPKNETFPEYGDIADGGNGTFFNKIYIGLK